MVNYQGFGEIIGCDIDLENRLPKTEKPASLHISESKFDLPALQLTNVHRAGLQARVGQNEEGIYLSWGNYGEFKIDQEANIQYQKLALETASMFLLSEVMGVACWQRGKFVLHAGAVEFNGKAHVIAGTPGMGKSTTIAALWQMGARVLSDDLVLIEINENGIYCTPAMSEIKIWEESVAGLGMNRTRLKPAFEGRNKYLLPTKNISSPFPLSSVNIISDEPMENFAALELLKYFPLPNQILVPTKLKRHFNESLIIQQNCAIRLIKPMDTFEELKVWTHQFLEKNA